MAAMIKMVSAIPYGKHPGEKRKPIMAGSDLNGKCRCIIVKHAAANHSNQSTMRRSPLKSVNRKIYQNMYLAPHFFPAPLFQMTNI